MSYSASRLTLYAVLSGIEDDLREVIGSQLGPQLDTEPLFGRHLTEKLRERRATEDSVAEEAETLGGLLEFADFGDLFQLLNVHWSLLPAQIGNHIRDETKNFERLVPIRNRVAHSRPLLFDDFPATIDIATAFCNTEALRWTSLRTTMQRLKTEPSFVLGLEIKDYSPEDRRHNLPTPDFDETGYLGRKQDVETLLRLVKGPYPVITIVGEGGLGKTATALKVAYDILDEPTQAFDTIVFVSSKTAQLTPNEIVKVQGAISDSLGVLTSVATTLAGLSAAEPMAEVLAYMAAFRILLIIDNLETVLDDRIKSFLEQLPAGSKVIITSRIGLGAYEYPFHLREMRESDAVQLLRALVKARQVPSLASTDNKNLVGYCARMHNNPGFIKWFTSAVQVGRRPEEILQNPALFLDFCMSNVYDFLALDSRAVLGVFLSVSGRHSQAGLAYFTRMSVAVLQRALQQLLTTNMLTLASVPRGSSYESFYEVSELARAYLEKHHPVSSDEATEFMSRRNKLLSAGQQLIAERSKNPYSPFSVALRSDNDLIVAKDLIDALNAGHRKSFDEAEEHLTHAKNLAPEYYEVHRVEAWLRALSGNMAAAKSAYEAAVELEPRAAHVRYFFGKFLLRQANDIYEAAKQLAEARKIDPGAAIIQIEAGRAALYAQHFPEARGIIDALLQCVTLSEWESRCAYHLHIQYFARFADRSLQDRENVAALESLERLIDAYAACPPQLLNDKQRDVLERAVRTARGCARNLAESVLETRAVAALERLVHTVGGLSSPALSTSLQGTVYRLNRKARYGYIQSPGSGDFYFLFDSLLRQEEVAALRSGARVSFRPGMKGRNSYAFDVRFEDQPAAQQAAAADGAVRRR